MWKSDIGENTTDAAAVDGIRRGAMAVAMQLTSNGDVAEERAIGSGLVGKFFPNP